MADTYDIGDIPEWTYLPRPTPAHPDAVSTAVEFTVIAPDNTPAVYTQASPEVAGDGTPGWVLTLPVLAAGDVGVWNIYAKSTAGIIESKGAVFVVQARPSTAPRARERWPVAWPADFDPGTASPLLVDLARDAAEGLLWALTGRRFGSTTTVETYRVPAASGECGRPYMSDDLVWHNNGRVAAVTGLRLAHGPVQSIVYVKLSGQTLAGSQYFLSGDELFRTGTLWPVVYDTDPPVIEVSYIWGEPLPPIAGLAMGELTAEILRGLTGGQCKLPSGLLTLVRQGVTKQFQDASVVFGDGRVGLPIADAWIKSDNPSKLRRRSRVYSPDVPRRVS